MRYSRHARAWKVSDRKFFLIDLKTEESSKNFWRIGIPIFDYIRWPKRSRLKLLSFFPWEKSIPSLLRKRALLCRWKCSTSSIFLENDYAKIFSFAIIDGWNDQKMHSRIKNSHNARIIYCRTLMNSIDSEVEIFFD